MDLVILDIITFITLLLFSQCQGINEIIYAVNAGGKAHVDSNGVKYLQDPSTVGIESDYGTRFAIRRIPTHDHILYQTERWHNGDFSYEVPIKEDGEYVLVLKFAEVYFNSPDQKVFDIRLNNRHMVVKNLDIYSKVGHGTAHDIYVPFTIQNGKLSVVNEFSTFNELLTVELKKGEKDNPKICAFYVMKGTEADVPKLPPLKEFDPAANEFEEAEDDEEVEEKPTKKESTTKRKVKSGPSATDPYADDGSSIIMPIMVAFGLFVPTLLCLCRL